MNVIQPLDLETGYRTFKFRDQNYLVITSKLYFPLLGNGYPFLFSEAYQELAELDSPFIDEGLPKVKSEFFVLGNAMSLNGEAVKAIDVSAKVANKEKRLSAIGNRYWTGGITGTTKPEPFTSMPLNWGNAFGGKENELNKEGKGTVAVKTPSGEELIPMPNIEYPNNLLTSPKQSPEPACFLPLMPDHPYRLKYMGTYDEKWITEDFPGYPKDFNFLALNASMPDQQLDGFFQGGEYISLKGLHDKNSVIESEVPKFNVKTFLVKEGKKWDQLNESDLESVECKIDTCVLFPNQLMGMIIYRGMVKIQSNDGSEYKYLLNAYEDNLTNRSNKDYLTSLIGRIHPELSIRYALTTKDLIPVTIPCGMARLTQQETEPRIIMAEHISEKFEETSTEKIQEVKSQLLQLIEEQKAQGLDTSMLETQLAELGNPVKDEWQLKFEAIADRLAPMDVDTGKLDLLKMDFTAFDDLSKLSEEYAEFQKEKAKSQLSDQIENAIKADQPEVADALSNALLKMDQPPELPRPANYKQTLAQLKAIKEQQPDQPIDLVDIEEKLISAHKAQIGGYKLGAHMMDKGTIPHANRIDEIQNWANEQIKAHKKVTGADLAGLDFSNMDLTDVDFSHCFLEQCNFRNSNLKGANLSHAIAAHCDFSYAKLENCNLENANIGGCKFINSHISSSHTADIEIAKSDFSHAKLGPINFSNLTNLLEVRFEKTEFQTVDFSEATFLSSTFTGSIIIDSIFNSATFNESELSNITVKNSQFIGCNIIESKLSNSKWRDSDLTNIRILNESSLTNCVFYHSILADATLRNISISHSQFLNCTLNRTDFSESDLTNACFSGSIAKDALFISSKLLQADMRNANYMISNFMQADLSEAKLSQANFYGCEFLGSHIYHTDFSGSILDGTKLQDWRPSKWQ